MNLFLTQLTLLCVVQMGIPKPVQWLIFNPRTKTYDRLFQQNMKYVIAGTPPPPPKKGWFW